MSILLTWLEAYYKLDESSWTTAFDSVGNKNGALVNSPMFVSWWKINNWLYFDGSDRRYIDIWTQIPGAFWDGNFSLSFWYKADSFTVLPAYFLSYNRDFQIRWDPGNFSAIQVWLRSWTTFYTITSSSLSVDTWYHIVVTRNTSTWLALYIDGSLSWSNPVTVNAALAATGDFETTKIGRRFTTSPSRDWKIDWTLDEVWIRSKALTSAEVTELYNSGSGLQYPFTVASTNNGNFFNFM